MNNNFPPFFQPNTENRMPPYNHKNSSSEIQLAKLAVFENVISIFGKIISAYADILALEEFQPQQMDDTYEERFKELERQIQYLTMELQKIKKKF